MENKNKFKIIIPSYNNEMWVEPNVASILNQSYTNYDVLYINDASIDETYNKVNDIVGKLSNWEIIKNKNNLGAAYNYIEYVSAFATNPNDIIIHLDGDDWLYDEKSLENLNNYYNKHDVWMTYGGFVCWDGEDTTLPSPQSTQYPDFVHSNVKYREDQWRASHLRTYRTFLWNSIDKEDLKTKDTGEYYWHGSDLAWQFPCLEMCPKDKIGVIDFYAHVYNQTESNTVRTQERESSENFKYEIEIRGRKKYKRCSDKKSLGKKMHQVNVVDERIEMCSIPSKFSYCYNLLDGDFDMFLLNDGEILQYLEGKIKIEKDVPIVVRLHEQRDYFQRNLMQTVIDNYDKFHTILTFDRIILNSVPNARFCNADGITQFVCQPNKFNEFAYHSELYKDQGVNQTIRIYPKDKFDKASCITTNKAFLPGHVTRLNFVKNIKDKVDLFGRGIREIPSKLDALHNYAFSVAIENNTSVDDYYFTEKLLECLVTGTVPIYHGCPNIGAYFDMDGIFTFSTQEELDSILNNLSKKTYDSMFESVKRNFQIATENFVLHHDSLYDLHLKHILGKK